MRALWIGIFLTGCEPRLPEDTGASEDSSDSEADDSDSRDSRDTSDTSDADASDSNADSDADSDSDTDPTPASLPERLKTRRWKQVFRDDFNGPPTPGDPCYDNDVTPPACLNRYWSREACPTPVHAQLANLNKCTWSVYNIYKCQALGWTLGRSGASPVLLVA